VICHDGLWGQVAVWPPRPCPGGLGSPRRQCTVPPGGRGLPRPVKGRGGTASHLTVSCNPSPGCRPVWYRPGRKPGEGLVHSSSRRPEVTGEADSGWALLCLPFGILSIPRMGPAYGLNSSKATRTARPAWALCGTRPDTATLLLARPRSRIWHCSSEGSHNALICIPQLISADGPPPVHIETPLLSRGFAGFLGDRFRAVVPE
jgi:hypothetical protein